jgi:endonuclease/exonuclease/phosphatase family metal-dependent hydrolase
LWALSRLADWSGMHAFPALTRRAPFGTVAGRLLTAPHQGIVRSAFSGQANAILVAANHEARDLGAVRISDRGHHPRACQAVRLGNGLVVANLHASGAVSEAEVGRALAWLEQLVKPDEPLVIAGDFNARAELPGFSAPGPGIDHVLVRSTAASPLQTWPEERRRQNGVLFSDHAPVELTIP